MYPEFETRTSYKYLQKVISALEEPICIIGGWAVFFHVNKSFQKAQGRPYLGSRDIDLGFHLDNNATIEQMKNSSLEKTASNLKESVMALEKLSEKDFTKENVKNILMKITDRLESRGELLHPVRYALSGLDKSPDPFVIAEVLGKNETLSRLQKAI